VKDYIEKHAHINTKSYYANNENNVTMAFKKEDDFFNAVFGECTSRFEKAQNGLAVLRKTSSEWKLHSQKWDQSAELEKDSNHALSIIGELQKIHPPAASFVLKQQIEDLSMEIKYNKLG